MECRRVFVVQDRETGRFLCPRLGDVGQCVLFRDAGHFDDIEDAVETGREFLEQDAIVMPIWIPER